MGIAALAIVVAGVLVSQTNFALSDRVLTQNCIAQDISPEDDGAVSVCNIVEALAAPLTTISLWLGVTLGATATILGFAIYRRQDSVRRREHAITGAVLGILAVLLALVLFWYRSGEPALFARSFLNFPDVRNYADDFVRAAKNTVLLAFSGEVGGIAIGMVLGMLTLSTRRAVRAPARIYINFFRGTPLIWQLFTGAFLLPAGFDIHLSTFTIAIIIFALNTGAYAAEVFRAGIQSIERGQMEAARSLGMSYLQAMRYAIVPQAVRRVIPPLMNEFVILIKDTALVFGLGLTASNYEIFTLAREGAAATFNATFFTVAAAAYLIVTLPLIRLVNAAERRLRSGLVGVAGTGL